MQLSWAQLPVEGAQPVSAADTLLLRLREAPLDNGGELYTVH